MDSASHRWLSVSIPASQWAIQWTLILLPSWVKSSGVLIFVVVAAPRKSHTGNRSPEIYIDVHGFSLIFIGFISVPLVSIGFR